MKKRILIFVFVFFLVLFSLFSNFIQAEELLSEEGLMGLEAKWQYLGKEWKTILLDNVVVGTIDSFLKKINIVFVVIFGIDYSLSFQFLFTVILWFFMLSCVHSMFTLISIFSGWASFLISIGGVILFVQTGGFKPVVNWFIWVLFGQKTWWMKLIIGIGTIVGLVLFALLVKQLAKQALANRKELNEEQDRINLHVGGEAGKAFTKKMSK
jgi:hypothetical protein